MSNSNKILQESCTVTAVDKIAADTFLLKLKAPRIAKSIRPGQMVFIRVLDREFPLLRRPFAASNASGNNLEIIFKVVGRGTSLLAAKKPGDKVDVLGPSGNGFPLADKSAGPVVAVAGEWV